MRWLGTEMMFRFGAIMMIIGQAIMFISASDTKARVLAGLFAVANWVIFWWK